MTDEQYEILQRIYRGEHDIEDRSSREENDLIESCLRQRWLRVTSSCNLDVTRRGTLAMGEHLDARQQMAEQEAKAKSENQKSNFRNLIEFVVQTAIDHFLK